MAEAKSKFLDASFAACSPINHQQGSLTLYNPSETPLSVVVGCSVCRAINLRISGNFKESLDLMAGSQICGWIILLFEVPDQNVILG